MWITLSNIYYIKTNIFSPLLSTNLLGFPQVIQFIFSVDKIFFLTLILSNPVDNFPLIPLRPCFLCLNFQQSNPQFNNQDINLVY